MGEKKQLVITQLIDEIVETFGEDCPDCSNVGWYIGTETITGVNYYTSEPEQQRKQTQVRCEFCYTNPKSKFNLEMKLLQLVQGVYDIISGNKK